MAVNAQEFLPVRHHYLFAPLEEGQFQRLLGAMTVIELDRGDLLFRCEDPAAHFYLVSDGFLKLVLCSPAGEQKVVEVLQPGHTFGEAVMFTTRRRYPVTAEALSACTVFAFPNEVYRTLLQENTDACFRLMGDMSQRLHARLREIESLTLENATHRLIHYLAGQLPSASNGSAIVDLHVSRQVLASRLSIKPETLSRIFRQLVESGVLQTDGKLIRIPDVERLRAYA